MITPETIITAELLSGITSCPFCGAKEMQGSEDYKSFECHKVIYIGDQVSAPERPYNCLESENTTIRARVSELEAKLTEVEELHAFELSPAMVQARNDQLNEKVRDLEAKVKRISDVGDCWIPRDAEAEELWTAAKEGV